MDRDLFSGIVMGVIGVVGFLSAGTIENQAITKMSGAFFPQVCFAAIFLGGLCLIWQSRRRTEKVKLPSFRIDKLAEIIVALVAYVFAMNYVGFVISSALFLVASMYLFGERNWKLIIPVAVVTAFVVWALFSFAFMIVLPACPGLPF